MRSEKTAFKTVAWMLVDLFLLEVAPDKEVCVHVQTNCSLQ